MCKHIVTWSITWLVDWLRSTASYGGLKAYNLRLPVSTSWLLLSFKVKKMSLSHFKMTQQKSAWSSVLIKLQLLLWSVLLKYIRWEPTDSISFKHTTVALRLLPNNESEWWKCSSLPSCINLLLAWNKLSIRVGRSMISPLQYQTRARLPEIFSIIP